MEQFSSCHGREVTYPASCNDALFTSLTKNKRKEKEKTICSSC